MVTPPLVLRCTLGAFSVAAVSLCASLLEFSASFEAVILGIVGAGLTYATLTHSKKAFFSTPPTLSPNGASHEVRTALNAVVGGIHVMRNTNDLRGKASHLEHLSASAENLEAVVLDLLESTSGVESDRVLQPAQVDLSRLCATIARTVRERAHEKGKCMDVIASLNVPYEAIVDRVKLFQLVNRLVSPIISATSSDETSFCLNFDSVTLPKRAQSDALRCIFSIRSTTSDLRSKLVALTMTNEQSRFKHLLEKLNGTGKFLTSTSEDTTDIEIIVPYTRVPTSNVDPLIATEGEILIVSDDDLEGSSIEMQLKTLGLNRFARIESSVYLSQEIQEFKPDTIIASIKSKNRDYQSLINTLSKATSSRIIPILDSLDEDATKNWDSVADIPALLFPYGIGELRNQLKRVKRNPAPAPSPSTGQRILVVDDVRVNRLVLTKHLESAGHEVISANNGDEAIKLLEASGHFSDNEDLFLKFGYDMVIMDIDMPVLGGLAATEKVRELENLLACSGINRHVPIIAATADAVGSEYERFILAGMEWFITKPIDPNRLFQLVDHFTGIGPRKSRQAPTKNSSIDLSWLRGQFAGDEDTVFEVVEAFLDEIDSLWLSLFKCSVGGTDEEIRSRAHALKGSLQNVGAHVAADIAKNIESSAKAQKTEEARELIDLLASEIKSAKECAIELRSQRVLNITTSAQYFS